MGPKCLVPGGLAGILKSSCKLQIGLFHSPVPPEGVKLGK